MAEAFGPALLLACWLAAPPDELDLVFDGAAFLLWAELEPLLEAEPFLFRLLPASVSESVPSSEAVEVVFRRFLLAAAFLLAFF